MQRSLTELETHWYSARVRRMGVHTFQEPVIYMRADSDLVRSEGFGARSRIRVQIGGRSIVATLNIAETLHARSLLLPGEIGLSEAAWLGLSAGDGDVAKIAYAAQAESFRYVRGKLYGEPISDRMFGEIIRDVAAGNYSDVQLAAFVSACGGDRLDLDEVVGLTRAMVDVGDRLSWPHPVIIDKHCVGGLPGNRTTPIVVAIVAAAGLKIPKTSSRAITSPAGTADTMETMAPVELSLKEMRDVVETEGGCIAWGGSVRLSPADDVLIGVQRALDIDSENQLVASILSKKAAAGSTHVVIDIPIGPTAKVRSRAAADGLAERMEYVAEALGLVVSIRMTDGRSPVGRGIGPALEARDVLSVLRGDEDAPSDLRNRALYLAGAALELAGATALGEGHGRAEELLDSGEAWRKFIKICEAQGGIRKPPVAPHTEVIAAERDGYLAAFDNRRLARLAKLTGAPGTPAAGLELHHRMGQRVSAGEPLVTLHAETTGALQYAHSYALEERDTIFPIEDDIATARKSGAQIAVSDDR